MAEKRSIIPKAPCIRMLAIAGAKRVSAEAADALSDILTEKALSIAEKAKAIAVHSKRRTIHGEDVRLAART
ncbi:NFYB/HAP3 family transcription factor subunit [Candidatus Woesearchaeota archaeon]|nr:NFYB/HAP3 family transcription factor subunit [Candidatus Woesearchaeota archaeon]